MTYQNDIVCKCLQCYDSQVMMGLDDFISIKYVEYTEYVG